MVGLALSSLVLGAPIQLAPTQDPELRLAAVVPIAEAPGAPVIPDLQPPPPLAPAWEPWADPGYGATGPADLDTPRPPDRSGRPWPFTDAATERRLSLLAKVLTRGARSDREKAEVLFRWVTRAIDYDVAGFTAQAATAPTLEEVLRVRVALCGGYASLFQRLGQLAGLEVRTVLGYAKGFDYRRGARFVAPNHAWNAVRLDGEWHLLDATWAAGRVERQAFVEAYDPFWFLTSPDEFLFSHLPVDRRWQLVDEPLSLEEFEEQPYVAPAQFGAGFRPEYVRALMRDPGFEGVPDVYRYGGRGIRIHNVPLYRALPPGARWSFRLEAAGASRVAVLNEGEWHPLRGEDGVFSGSLRLRPGTLTVNAQYPDRGPEYWPVLVYRVEGSGE